MTKEHMTKEQRQQYDKAYVAVRPLDNGQYPVLKHRDGPLGGAISAEQLAALRKQYPGKDLIVEKSSELSRDR